jgi:transketolase
LNDLDYNVFVMLGDGEQHEGQVWEAALSAAHHRTGNLIAIVDRNEYSLDGKVDDVIGIEPVVDKWEAFGWNTIDIDGHDVAQVLGALREATARAHDGVPTVIVAHTVKGKGIPYMETEFGWHLGYLAPSDEERALAHLRSNA